MGNKNSKSEEQIKYEKMLKDLDPTTRKYVKLVKKYGIDVDPHVDEKKRIDLGGSHNKLSVRNINKLGSSGISNLNKLFKEAEFKDVQVLFLSGNEMNLSKLNKGLEAILPKVKKQVFLSQFTLSKKDLAMLFEKCSEVENLTIAFSRIANPGKKWKLDKSLNYKIKELSIFGSCHRSWSDHLTEKKLKHFIRGLSETNLVDTLTDVYTKEDWYLAERMQPVFDEAGFKVKVHGGNTKPTPFSTEDISQ